MVPSYLNNIAINITNKKNRVSFDIICECGSRKFVLYKKQKSPVEKKQEKQAKMCLLKEFGRNFTIESDEYGNSYIVKRNIFGKIAKREPTERYIHPEFKNFVNAKCPICGHEYNLFNEQVHGHDALCSIVKEHESPSPTYEKEEYFVNIQVEYNEDLKACNQFTDKTIAFGRIKILKTNGGTQKTVLDCECE